jgi:hypothetical protein
MTTPLDERRFVFDTPKDRWRMQRTTLRRNADRRRRTPLVVVPMYDASSTPRVPLTFEYCPRCTAYAAKRCQWTGDVR